MTSPEDLRSRLYFWLGDYYFGKRPDGETSPPVDPLAIAGGRLAALHAKSVCRNDGGMNDALFDHCVRFAEWMYRYHRKKVKKVFPRSDMYTSGLEQGLALSKKLSKFASDWVYGKITPPQALERLQQIRRALNNSDRDHGTDGDDFWEMLLLDDPRTTLYRRFKPADYRRLLAMGKSAKRHKGSYHSDCLATAGVVSSAFSTAHARIRINAPVIVFPMVLCAGSARAAECEYALMDVNLTVTGTSPHMGEYNEKETTVELETIWGEGQSDHEF